MKITENVRRLLRKEKDYREMMEITEKDGDYKERMEITEKGWRS